MKEVVGLYDQPELSSFSGFADGHAVYAIDAAPLESSEPDRRPKSWISPILIGMELILALAGIVGGISLIADPSGRLIAMSLSVLDHTPFSDLLVPGIALLVVNGLFPLAVAVEALARGRWAAAGHVAVGVAVIGWIAVQFVVMGYQLPVQIIILVWGATILGLAAFNLAAQRSRVGRA